MDLDAASADCYFRYTFKAAFELGYFIIDELLSFKIFTGEPFDSKYLDPT